MKEKLVIIRLGFEQRKHMSMAKMGIIDEKEWMGFSLFRKERKTEMARMEYQLWRKSILERDLWTCQICEKKEIDLQVDHIKPWSIYPELRLSFENGRTLCKNCHRKTDTYGINNFQKRNEICQE